MTDIDPILLATHTRYGTLDSEKPNVFAAVTDADEGFRVDVPATT